MKRTPLKQKTIAGVFDASLALLSPSAKKDLYPVVHTTLKKLVGSSYVSIYRLRHGELVKVYTSFPSFGVKKARKDGFTYKSFKEALPFFIDNKRVYSIHPKLKDVGVKSTLILPLSFQKDPIGVLSVDFAEHKRLSPVLIKTLELFAAILTYKIRNLDLQKRLEEILENQKLFISLASHELKNPLTAIIGFTGIIEKQAKKDVRIPPQTISLLSNEVNRMAQLVDELLNARNSETEQLQLKYKRKPRVVKQVIASAIASFRLSHPERTIIFEYDGCESVQIYGDAQKIKQVMSNLLVNAAKFSDKSQPIRVILMEENGQIIIQVLDKGIGISRKDLPNVFKRFYKGNATGDTSGKGLGLYLCKEIVESHEGTIHITSKKGSGTTVTISLPCYEL